MLKTSNESFNSTLLCSQPIPDCLVQDKLVRYFDKDGFELTPLEIMYYEAEGVAMNDYLYNYCAQRPWILAGDLPDGLAIDHSMILERYAFASEAREQLERYRSSNRGLTKLLSTKQKWGIDFSLDYIANDEVVDVFHIEQDSYNLTEIEEMRERASFIILSTDWLDGAKQVLKHREQWCYLEGHRQSDWKAQFFGFAAAEHIRKAF